MATNVSVVLMYHALYRNDDTSAISAEDLPYAVSEADFVAQLDLLKSSLAESGVATFLTFDDGHASNFTLALPRLIERGMHAWFFVTTGFVGQRAGFCDEAQVRALADAGMTIGSHGATHRFLDDLDRDSAWDELRDSRSRLSAITGHDVASLSFPGGRFSPETLTLARQAGYQTIFGSRIGLAHGLAHGLAQGLSSADVGYATDDEPRVVQSMAAGTIPMQPLARIAVRRHTRLDEFQRIVTGDPRWFRQKRRLQGLKQAARTVLGNRIYHGLYKHVS